MAGHDLSSAYLDAYLASLTGGLPAAAVDELADGLTETYRHHLDRGLSPDAAARAAVTEFGAPDVVLTAFVDQAPGRRAARILLTSGPVVGGCWGLALLAGHAWAWPIPAVVRLAFGGALLAVIAVLAAAATGHRSLRRTRLAAAGGIGLFGLDAAMLATAALTAPAATWPLAVAATASLTRMAVTARFAPRLLTAR